MKLVDFMKDKGLTPDAVAAAIGDVTASGVRKWMGGERIPRRDQMERLAEFSVGRVMPNDFFDLGEFTEGDPDTGDGHPSAAAPAGPDHPPSQAGAGQPIASPAASSACAAFEKTLTEEAAG